MVPRKSLLLSFATLVAVVSGCGGGSGSGGATSGGDPNANFNCDGGCANQSLSVDDVTTILRQAVTAAQNMGVAGTFAITDRTGNVLALYQMNGAPQTTTINGQTGASGPLEGLAVPSTLAAISKAGTGAYLSTQGNAFSTRTAGQIIQQNYLPGQRDQAGGPLFGVQFSSLICSDVTRANGATGPRPLPIGLSADPGGFPLYKQGDPVGGIGVEFNGLYTIDPDLQNYDSDPEEMVALSASTGFSAPAQRVGDNISLAGRSLRYSNTSFDQIVIPTDLAELDPGAFKSQPSYTNGRIKAGTVFGTPESGISDTVKAGLPAAVITGRFPTTGGRTLPSGAQLSASEVNAILDSALTTAHRARAAIRTPLDTSARVSIFVVDNFGNPIGFIRSQDAPVFGVDVALQKARVAAFMSSPDAGATLSAGGQGSFAAQFAAFTGTSLDGSHAFAARSVGNLSRPYFPDGINGNENGPFSLPFPGTAPGQSWSVFNTGLQLNLVLGGLAGPILNPGLVPNSCTNGAFGGRIRNGIQIFPGGVPLYRNGVLIGAVGVSGDGIDQDDMVAYYGSSRVGLDYVGYNSVGDSYLGFNAPTEIRADQIVPRPNARLRYVNCPEAPFSGSNEQNVCVEGQG